MMSRASPVDALLTNTLASLRSPIHARSRAGTTDQQLLPATATLLTALSDPRNISLLTSQLLLSPTVWGPQLGSGGAPQPQPQRLSQLVEQQRSSSTHVDVVAAAIGVLGAYNGAAARVRAVELERRRRKGALDEDSTSIRTRLSSDEWVRAVAAGLHSDDGRNRPAPDQGSARWQHLVVLAGVLLGMTGPFPGTQQRQQQPQVDPTTVMLSGHMRHTLEQAVLTAATLALQEHAERAANQGTPQQRMLTQATGACIALALAYAQPHLPTDALVQRLDWDSLVPLCVGALCGPEGFNDGIWLGAVVDVDVVQAQGGEADQQQFDWSPAAPSFLMLKKLEARPVVAAAGPLARLAGVAVERARRGETATTALAELVQFSGRLLEQWQLNKLCEIDASEETLFLTSATLSRTWPVLWDLLRKVLYADVAVLQAIVGRALLDPALRGPRVATRVAMGVLHVLRNLYFVSSRAGNSAFEMYTFTNLAALDILSRHGDACAAFLEGIRPQGRTIPPHPLHRTLDLFYLNTAEHLPVNLGPELCDALIVQPATVYLVHESDVPLSRTMTELFEAAHSAVLAVLSCPHNGQLATRLVPWYVDQLLAAFPARGVSPRQFRLAFRTLVEVTSPPYPIAAEQPDLPEMLLEVVRHRALTTASTALLPPPAREHALSMGRQVPPPPASEQSILVLAIIDALPFAPLPLIETWLTLAARAVHAIGGPDGLMLRRDAIARFWDVLVGGPMDVDRAALGAVWWGTLGGRELLLHGRGRLAVPQEDERYLMSGALGGARAEESRL